MATTPKRGIKNVTDEKWAEMYARFINNDVDYEKILPPLCINTCCTSHGDLTRQLVSFSDQFWSPSTSCWPSKEG